MNKNLEELKKIEDEIFKTDIKKLGEKELTYMMEKIVHCEILILEGFASGYSLYIIPIFNIYFIYYA